MCIPFLDAQGRIEKLAAKAACVPHGEQGENLPCPIKAERGDRYDFKSNY